MNYYKMQLYSVIHKIPEDIFNNEDIYVHELEHLKILNNDKAIKKYIKKNYSNIRRGDVVHF